MAKEPILSGLSTKALTLQSLVFIVYMPIPGRGEACEKFMLDVLFAPESDDAGEIIQAVNASRATYSDAGDAENGPKWEEGFEVAPFTGDVLDDIHLAQIWKRYDQARQRRDLARRMNAPRLPECAAEEDVLGQAWFDALLEWAVHGLTREPQQAPAKGEAEVLKWVLQRCKELADLAPPAAKSVQRELKKLLKDADASKYTEADQAEEAAKRG